MPTNSLEGDVDVIGLWGGYASGGVRPDRLQAHTKVMSPTKALGLIPPKVSWPLVTPDWLLGAKEIPTSFVAMSPCMKALSVTVGIVSLPRLRPIAVHAHHYQLFTFRILNIECQLSPWVRSVGPILDQGQYIRSVRLNCLPKNAVDTVESLRKHRSSDPLVSNGSTSKGDLILNEVA